MLDKWLGMIDAQTFKPLRLRLNLVFRGTSQRSSQPSVRGHGVFVLGEHCATHCYPLPLFLCVGEPSLMYN